MALNFPPNPNSGDRWTVGTKTYQWSGSAWLVAIQNNISSGIITITSSTNATSTTTGALVVTGGIGLGGDLWIGGTIYSGSAPVLTTSSLGGSVFGGTDISITSTGTTGTSFLRFDDISTLQSVTDRGHTTTNLMVFSNATESVSTITGALVVRGGVGIGGGLVVGGTVTATNFVGSISGTASTASRITTIAQTANANYFPTFVVSNNATATGESVYTTSTFTINPSTGVVIFRSTTTATSTASGALQVVGGVGVGGGLVVGGGINGNLIGGSTGALVYQSSTSTTAFLTIGSSGQLLTVVDGMPSWTSLGALSTATDLAGGTAGQVPYQTAPGVTSFYGSGTAGNVLVSNGTGAPTYNNTLTLVGTTIASSTASGALQVVGGVGIGGNLYVGGNITVSGTINASVTTATSLASGTAGQVPYQTAPGVTSFYGPGTAGNLLVSNGTSAPTYNNTLTLVGTTAASSTATGALQVRGGVGIGGDLFLGGNFTQVGGTYATLAATYNLINTTATTVNFAGAGTTITIGASASGTTTIRNNLTVAGNLTVQGTTTIVDSTVTNIVDPIITLGGLANNAAPIADDNKDRGIAFKYVSAGSTSTGFFGYDDSTGYLTYVPIATITNEVVSGTKGAIDANLAGGTAMSLVYQSAVDTTAFLAASTAGYILQTNGTGTAPSWVSATGISVGSATYADSVRTISQNSNTTYFPTFVDSNNASNTYELVYTTSSFSINPSTGVVIFGSTTAATSTATGALQVRGGAGIVGGLFVGGNASLLGNKLATKYLTLSPNTIATDVSSLGAYIQLGNPVSNQPPDVSGIQFANYSGSSTGLAAIRYNNGGANYGLELNASTLSSDKIRLVAGATGGVIVTSLTNTTSTTTGALQVVGGVGIGGGLFVGGTMTATSAQITTGLSVGATAPSATAGEIRATNEITAYYSSDRRLKENIKLIADPITIVNQIRGVRFDWTDEHIQKRGGEDGYFVRKHDIGVIAQEVEAVLPEIVATRDDGTKVVKYEKLVALLIEAVKEQQKQINQISQALERLASK